MAMLIAAIGPASAGEARQRASPMAATLTAIGVVYGDLGTSPLYTLQTVVQAVGGKFSAESALGVLSLIVWTLIITISIKYCLFVMRADNYGDGVITPAISVLSALEGVNVLTSTFKPFIMPAAVAILLALFAVQRLGTEKIGRAFGPIMLLWLIVIAALGLAG